MNPCYDCDNRNVHCHSVCEEYKSFQKEREEILINRSKKIRQNNDYMAAKNAVRKIAISKGAK